MARLSRAEVTRRWLMLCPKRKKPDKSPEAPNEFELSRGRDARLRTHGVRGLSSPFQKSLEDPTDYSDKWQKAIDSLQKSIELSKGSKRTSPRMKDSSGPGTKQLNYSKLFLSWEIANQRHRKESSFSCGFVFAAGVASRSRQ